MIAIPYYQTDDRVNLTRPLPNPYEGWSPLELEDEKVRHTLALFRAREGNRTSDAAFHEHCLDLIEREIREQQAILLRNAADPRAVHWPDHRQRYEALREIAQNLKRDYRLHDFIDSCVPSTCLKRTGPHRWIGHCPIPTHPGEDTNPSFVVYEDDPDGQHFHCYGCGAHGDIFDLANHLYGYVRFEDQVRIVATAFRIEVTL